MKDVMNKTSLTRDDLRTKLQSLDDEYKNLTVQLSNLKSEADKLRYLYDNFNNIAGLASNSSQSTLPFSTPLAPSLDTKRLLLLILKNENRGMTWVEIFNIFKNVKPTIAESTVRVSLSQMNKDVKYPVKLIHVDGDFRYIYQGEKQ